MVYVTSQEKSERRDAVLRMSFSAQKASEALKAFGRSMSFRPFPKRPPFNPRLILFAPTTNAEITVCMFYYGRISQSVK